MANQNRDLPFHRLLPWICQCIGAEPGSSHHGESAEIRQPKGSFDSSKIAASPVAAQPNFPVLSGRVVDDAGILNDGTIQNLTGMLEKHEQATGEQVVVVTLKSLGGYAIEDYGYQLGRKWGSVRRARIRAQC
jgi:TPM domain